MKIDTYLLEYSSNNSVGYIGVKNIIKTSENIGAATNYCFLIG